MGIVWYSFEDESMKKLILLLLISLMGLMGLINLMGCASIQHNIHTWTWKNTVLEASCVTLSTIDAVQTANHARDNWNGWEEQNPILGKYPHQDTVYAYFASWVLIHGLVALILPEEWRYVWQGACIVGEGYTTITNEQNRRKH
jgi:hypothetical protein